MRKRQRIYVMLNDSEFDRCIYENVSVYFSEKASEIEVSLSLDELNADTARTSLGIITRVLSARDKRFLRTYDVPVVNVSGFLESPGFPSVVSDHIARGRIVAEHLLSRRFHNFGYYGTSDTNLEQQSFQQRIHASGFQCALQSHVPNKYIFGKLNSAQQRDIRKWLKHLPKPIGIFCANDRYAWELSKACDELDIIVGRDVGIVGSGNYEFFCMTGNPHLSSTDNRPDRIGYEAAALLLRLIRGKKTSSAPILIPPTLVARASSDIFVTEDSYVSAAIQYIQQHISETLSPQKIFKHIPLSRTALERRFRKQLDYSILETIHLLKIDHIKHLLISTSKNIEDIANTSGLSGGANMTTLFREKVGITPSEYRNRFQGNMPLSKA
ncbi:MAG: substrate-binding domain-containing protein [Chthoniobacterales bacterium]